jgi:hypothetical protein
MNAVIHFVLPKQLGRQFKPQQLPFRVDVPRTGFELSYYESLDKHRSKHVEQWSQDHASGSNAKVIWYTLWIGQPLQKTPNSLDMLSRHDM